jgi:hypothetical protein
MCHQHSHKRKHQDLLPWALFMGLLAIGIYLINFKNTSSWQETRCVVAGSRVIPADARGKRNVVIYRGQYQLRYTVNERDYYVWADSEWEASLKEFVQNKMDHLPEHCNFRVRYNPQQPAEAIAVPNK